MSNDTSYKRGQRLRAADVNALREVAKREGAGTRAHAHGSAVWPMPWQQPSAAKPVHALCLTDTEPYSVLALRKNYTTHNLGIHTRPTVSNALDTTVNTAALYTAGSRRLKANTWVNVFPVTPWMPIRVRAADEKEQEPDHEKMDGLDDPDILPKTGDFCGPISNDDDHEGFFSKTRCGFVCVGHGIEMYLDGPEGDPTKCIDVLMMQWCEDWWGKFLVDVDFAEDEFVKCEVKTSYGLITRWCRNGSGYLDAGEWNAETRCLIGKTNSSGFHYDIKTIMGCPPQ